MLLRYLLHVHRDKFGNYAGCVRSNRDADGLPLLTCAHCLVEVIGKMPLESSCVMTGLHMRLAQDRPCDRMRVDLGVGCLLESINIATNNRRTTARLHNTQSKSSHVNYQCTSTHENSVVKT